VNCGKLKRKGRTGILPVSPDLAGFETKTSKMRKMPVGEITGDKKADLLSKQRPGLEAGRNLPRF
jgi:hypothetical protein